MREDELQSLSTSLGPSLGTTEFMGVMYGFNRPPCTSFDWASGRQPSTETSSTGTGSSGAGAGLGGPERGSLERCGDWAEELKFFVDMHRISMKKTGALGRKQ